MKEIMTFQVTFEAKERYPKMLSEYPLEVPSL